MGSTQNEPNTGAQDELTAQPVPALVNAVLLSIAQAYIPQLRQLDAERYTAMIQTGDPHLIFVPSEQLETADGVEPDESGNTLALGTVAFSIPDEESSEDAYRIFLNVVPYSEQNIEIALEADALAHAMGAVGAGEDAPVQTYSLWFAVGAPEDRLDSPEMYVIGPDGIDTADTFPVDGSFATTLIAFTDMWPPSAGQEHAYRFWNLLDELAQRIVISLIDDADEN